MSKLSAKQRANLRPKDFGLPERARTKAARKESGNYPMPDRDHAISAISRAEREYERGNLTKGEFERIQRKAEKKLRKKTAAKSSPTTKKRRKKRKKKKQ
jgi:hypothetical protein